MPDEPKPTKTDFCRSFDWSINIHWSGLVGMHQFVGDRVVKIQLVTRATHEHYEGFRVTILNKNEGPIDTTVFWFSDHLERDLEKSSDDHRHRFEVISYVGWKWAYGAAPKSLRPFCEAVEYHLNFFY